MRKEFSIGHINSICLRIIKYNDCLKILDEDDAIFSELLSKMTNEMNILKLNISYLSGLTSYDEINEFYAGLVNKQIKQCMEVK